MSESFRHPTLHDVARLAGVSHMTVSRALKVPHLVAAPTLEKVRHAIRQLGYRPDPVLSALAAYRSNGGGRINGEWLAFLDCDHTPYSQIVFAGARQEAALLGYGVDSCKLPSNLSAQRRLCHTLFHRGMRGLIFGPSDSRLTLEGWNWKEFATVSLGAMDHEPPLHNIAMDYFHGAWQGFEILTQRGCRRIGFVIDPLLEARTGHRWLGGYVAAGGNSRWIYNGNSSALKSWTRRQKLDGVLTIHQEVYEILKAEGLQFAFLNDQNAPASVTRLTLDPAKIGIEAVRLLHHMLLRREYGLPSMPHRVALQASWKFM